MRVMVEAKTEEAAQAAADRLAPDSRPCKEMN